MVDFICLHILKDKEKNKSIYIYKLIGKDLVICKDCEKRLRKQILEQNKLEKKLKILKKERRKLKNARRK